LGGNVLPDNRRLLEGGGEGGGYDPQDLRSAYNIPSGVGTTQTIALVDAFGYPNAESDLTTYRERYGLTPCTRGNGCFKKVNENGEEANYPKANSPEEEQAWEAESALDLDMASAACPECHIVLVQSSTESVRDLSEANITAVKLGATEISNSWGLTEKDPLCGIDGCAVYGESFHHPGVVTAAAAGDAGYDDEHFHGAAPEFPASSPYVVAVGGTSLHKAEDARGWSESVWDEPIQGAATGSGCSLFEPKPSWQTDAACTGRTDNDVAAVAASATPVSVYSTAIPPPEGPWALLGGTSVSSPLIAGIMAHASESARSLEGGYAFYQDPSSLFDVTTGNNGSCTPPFLQEYLCTAGVGYDGPSGMGTPDGVPVVQPLARTSSAGTSQPAPSVTGVRPNQGLEMCGPPVKRVTASTAVWREGGRLASYSRTHGVPVGTTFTITLNCQARVSLRFTERMSGRAVGGRCVAQTQKNTKGHTCKRAIVRGMLSFSGRTGSNKVFFEGRISSSRRLPPGFYALVVATASGGTDPAQPSEHLSFTIAK
jgi:hypothetical protein